MDEPVVFKHVIDELEARDYQPLTYVPGSQQEMHRGAEHRACMQQAITIYSSPFVVNQPLGRIYLPNRFTEIACILNFVKQLLQALFLVPPAFEACNSSPKCSSYVSSLLVLRISGAQNSIFRELKSFLFIFAVSNLVQETNTISTKSTNSD